MAVLAIETENNTVCVYAKIKGRKKEERKEERRKKEVFEKRKKIREEIGIFSLPALPCPAYPRRRREKKQAHSVRGKKKKEERRKRKEGKRKPSPDGQKLGFLKLHPLRRSQKRRLRTEQNLKGKP